MSDTSTDDEAPGTDSEGPARPAAKKKRAGGSRKESAKAALSPEAATSRSSLPSLLPLKLEEPRTVASSISNAVSMRIMKGEIEITPELLEAVRPLLETTESLTNKGDVANLRREIDTMRQTISDFEAAMNAMALKMGIHQELVDDQSWRAKATHHG